MLVRNERREQGMRKSYSNRLLSLALVAVIAFSSVLAGNVTGQSAQAASKKVTLKFKKSSYTVKEKKTLSLKSQITKKNISKVKKLVWTSKNKKIATVSAKGTVTGVKAGNTVVTCKVQYKASGKKTYQTKTIQTKVKVSTSGSADEKFTVKWNDKSNIGSERTVSIVGGTSDSMIVKDNGEMRKDLSTQYLIKNEMGTGINLGNTMEATKAIGEIDNFKEATDFEQAWSAPITTQKYIDSVHSYGFNTIRIPVAWSSMISKDGNYTISDKMLGRVEEIVNYALNNGMYVIINDHYDYGWWGMFGSSDDTIRAKAWKKYEAIWTQISERFKNYSDHLIFESANEELTNHMNDANLGLNTAINPKTETYDGNYPKGTLTLEECYETANKINQTFVNVVRKSGGNNEYRHLLIAGFGTNINNTLSSNYVMPTDTVEGNGNTKLSVSVHYYDPWEFCGDGMSGATYTEKDKEATEKQFAKLKKFTDQGYGVIVGEFGVCNPLQDGVTKWLQDTMEIAAKNGCIPLLWDTPGTYFDREACVMQFKDVAEMYNSITGASGDTNINSNTGFVKADVNYYTTLPESAKQVFQWKGEWKKNDGSNIGLDGNLVTSSGIEQFIKTESVSENEQITFNDWGYQSFLKLDWSKYKNPVVYCTFKEDTADAVGEVQFATTKKINGSIKDTVTLGYSAWNGKYISIPGSILNTLQTDTEKKYMYFTFGNAPVVTSITVYDLEK